VVPWLVTLLGTERAVLHCVLADLVVLHPIAFLVLPSPRSFILSLYHLLYSDESTVFVGLLGLLPRSHGRDVGEDPSRLLVHLLLPLRLLIAQQLLLVLFESLWILWKEPVTSGVIDGSYGALWMVRSHLPLEISEVPKTASGVVLACLRLPLINRWLLLHHDVIVHIGVALLLACQELLVVVRPDEWLRVASRVLLGFMSTIRVHDIRVEDEFVGTVRQSVVLVLAASSVHGLLIRTG